MSVSQLEPSSGGGGKYEMKRSAMFSSQSSFSSRVNGDNAPPGGISANSTGMTANSSGISAPFSGITPPSSGIPASFSGMTVPPGAKSEVTQFSSEKRETTQQFGNQPASRSESETIKEYKNINGVESRNEKSTESSSSNFSELINRHEILSSGGSHGSIPALVKSSSSSSITKTGQRKSVAPRFISPLNGKIVDLGADVVLEAIIEGYPTPDVKWSKNGLPLGSIPGKVTVSFEHNKARLELKNTTTEDGGRYTVTLENTTGSAGSTADLIVKKSIFPPVMCRRLLPQSIYTGDRLVMEVEIAGTPTPSIQWFKDNYPISSQSQEYRLRQQGNSYAVIVEKATLSNSGTYKVTATNEGGEAISSADVRVTDKTVISSIPGIPSVIPFSQELQPSLLQTDNKRDYSNSSNFFKQQQQTQQQTQQREQQQQSVSSYQTQENLSVSKTLIKEDKNVNLKVTNDTMPLNMPYSIQSSTTESSHKETIIPVQTDNKTYLENQQTETTTNVIDSDQTSEGLIEHTSIPKKCALDFFKNIIQENESEQKYLKETEKPLPPSFLNDNKRKPGTTSPLFPHSDDQIPSEFSRNILSSETKTQTWKPVSPVPYDDTPLYLEPGPPPEICYTTDAPSQPTETFAERIKKMEEKKETTTTAEPVRPPYKPFESKPVVEEVCTRTKVESGSHTDQTYGRRVTSPPIQPDNLGPVLRPQADIHVRPTSPRPSAEGVSMEKLWTTKIHKESEITHPASPLARPPSPKSNIVSEIRESSQTEIKRCVSPRPSAEGVRMDKMWTHSSSQQKTAHPTSLMPDIPVPTKPDDEDEEAKRMAWSRKYLQEEETSTRTVKTVTQPAAPVYNPPSTPAPVYKPPTPAPAPVYKPPTPAPAPVYVKLYFPCHINVTLGAECVKVGISNLKLLLCL
uniref:Titin n=1 Tax=Cacopsylla melanoneura TaxID=428564 RepID=A0A8D8UCW3_9HEMI